MTSTSPKQTKRKAAAAPPPRKSKRNVIKQAITTMKTLAVIMAAAADQDEDLYQLTLAELDEYNRIMEKAADGAVISPAELKALEGFREKTHPKGGLA
jgi:predicted GH43/DUF377 family glycosyl hydrolase